MITVELLSRLQSEEAFNQLELFNVASRVPKPRRKDVARAISFLTEKSMVFIIANDEFLPRSIGRVVNRRTGKNIEMAMVDISLTAASALKGDLVDLSVAPSNKHLYMVVAR